MAGLENDGRLNNTIEDEGHSEHECGNIACCCCVWEYSYEHMGECL